ncbi:PCI domain-containing protein 2 isoform X2 [Phymastichus coffea]|uniref:PCI domain-containing protein 2 isoform X2 n=1 Tax=Phymastichus coffea TaxID=108790 RepID=UPI00273ADE76|nr:PCI domain-containing protein 2 isoform X2 [Phymastichus coffea]
MDAYITLRRAWSTRDGPYLADLLSIRRNIHWHATSENVVREALDGLPMPFDDLVLCHLKTLSSLNKDDISITYTCQNSSVQMLIKILQNQKDENWMLPVMNLMCLELRLLAIRAEQAKKSKNLKPGETLEKCAECLMSCFRICAADNRSSEDDTKRWGMLSLVNQLLKVYFRINKLHLCKPLIRAIESSIYKDHFSLAQQITYKFFVGRKAMFDSDYKTADEYLTYAFQHCHKGSMQNKRLILLYLVPVKMLLGILPKYHLLKKYNLLEFSDLIDAVRKGNIQSLESVMSYQEGFLINAGIYLIVEKLKLIAYRNLFKKVYLVLKTHQIDMECLLGALKIYGRNDLDIDETECIVANLIFDGKIKGYISHQHKKLVISKQNPFPKLSSLV